MLKKFLAVGAVVAGFAGMGLSAPAQANSEPWPVNENHYNIASQNDNVSVCGNRAIGDITLGLITLNPMTDADDNSVDCSFKINQKN